MEIERTKQKEHELLIEKEHTKQMGSKYSRTPSGVHTPCTPGGSRSKGSLEGRSPGYYYDELRLHFKAANDPNKYGMTLTKYKLDIVKGKTVVYTCDSTGVEVRNVYIMMSACDYEVESFLVKLKKSDFGEDFTLDKSTPPRFSHRSNVFAPVLK